MRLSHCETYCAAPLCYIPCLPKSKDAPPPAAADAVAAAPCPVEDKPPQVQKIEVVAPAAADKDEDDKEHEHGDKTAPRPLPKSNLKKANCGEDGVCAPKGNVKWLDLLGKDLTEVKEFEPSESGDSMDDEGISTCVCVIQ
ncbi:unnamed protein product [Triticum turgidum subsp. durum]|uniref:Uncharacterized protein n=1 Tax=Triticum turgidum subsp. durum TaxID=4567 RepID=A0A9R1AS08_TRITD|nr:unnamed protein product [Triticum turgidum subsp. durum]